MRRTDHRIRIIKQNGHEKGFHHPEKAKIPRFASGQGFLAALEMTNFCHPEAKRGIL